jgi:hypothetical protein
MIERLQPVAALNNQRLVYAQRTAQPNKGGSDNVGEIHTLLQ